MHVHSLWQHLIGKVGAGVSAALMLGLSSGVTPAGAVVLNCGATVGPGGAVVLTADVGPCDDDTDPALTVIGPVSFNLNGHKVFCADTDMAMDVPDGIVVEGSGAAVINGTVEACKDGVITDGAGGHALRRLNAVNNESGRVRFFSRVGFFILDSNNALSRLSASGSQAGFVIVGSNNALVQSTATGNSEAGFFIAGSIDPVTFVTFKGNTNTLNRNTADGNGVGFVIIAFDPGLAEGNVIANSTATANSDSGFAVDANNNRFDRNRATDNGDGKVVESRPEPDFEDGFTVQRDNNQLTNNIAIDNFEDGFDVLDGATGNTLTGNQSSGHTPTPPDFNPDFDLEDDNPNCDANVWKLNRGTRRNQACIK